MSSNKSAKRSSGEGASNIPKKPSQYEKEIGSFIEKLAWTIAMNIVLQKYVEQ